MTKTRSAALMLGALLLVAAAPAPMVAPPVVAPPTVILVARHAERAPGTGDVPLSAEGEARARVLATVGREARVDAIITT